MPTPSPARRADGSMALLVDLMRSPDPAYADAAAARGAAPARGRVHGATALVVLVGLLGGTAAAAVRAASGDRGPARAGLVAQVRQRTADVDALTGRAAALRADVAELRAAVPEGAGSAAALQLSAATTPVTGPGVLAVLDDRPATGGAAQPGGGAVGSGRVLDRDLQALVNVLWAAGAEAVSVDDVRVTARTAIRSAGEAVLVDYRPLSPPYEVRAVGDPSRLQAELADSPAGRRLRTYATVAGLRLDVTPATALQLPAGTVPEPRAASPAPPS